jgi:diguanylate cyclase (GGDEF)-like protein
MPRESAFFAHATSNPNEIAMIHDAPNEWGIRFYAGAPLVTQGGEALGALCVMDKEPRQLTEDQQFALRALARQAMAQLELRRLHNEQQHAQEELRAANARLQKTAGTDKITGLLGQSSCEARLREEIGRARRHQRPLSLVLLNIDDFHNYNDSFGHAAGDDVLRVIASVLQKNARETDILGCMSGDDFVAILPETDEEGALKMAGRCRSAIANANWPSSRVTVSIGLAISSAATTAEELLELADTRVYQSRQRGRNQITHA